MKLSTKGQYGVRAMLDLAQHHGQGPISLKNVAERQGISEHYLEQLVAVLRKAGLVKSVRGAQGGYTLGREPQEISVGDIIRVLEGPISPVECVGDADGGEYCDRAGTCITKGIWEEVKVAIEQVLDSHSLEELAREAEELKNRNANYMFHI